MKTDIALVACILSLMVFSACATKENTPDIDWKEMPYKQPPPIKEREIKLCPQIKRLNGLC